MDFFKIDGKGPIFIEKMSTLPAWTSVDEGRLIYIEDVNKYYIGDNSKWNEGIGAIIGTDLKDSTGAVVNKKNILNTDTNEVLFNKTPMLYDSGVINKIDFKISNSQASVGWFELCRYKCVGQYDAISIFGNVQYGSHTTGYNSNSKIQIKLEVSNPDTLFGAITFTGTGMNQTVFNDVIRIYYYQDAVDSKWVIKVYIKLTAWIGIVGNLFSTCHTDPSSGGFSWWDTDQNQADSLGAAYTPAGTQKSITWNYAESANNYVHPNHSGDITSTGDGATVIGNDKVTNTKLANMAANVIKGRQSSTGDPQDLAPANVRTIINVADGANNYSHPNHSGDITSTGDGATVIGNDKVSNPKLTNMAADTMKGRLNSVGDPQDLTVAQVNTLLGTSGVKPVSFISKSGYNSQFIIVNDKLFSAAGSPTQIPSYTTGRGTTASSPFYGVNLFKKVNFPNETGTLTKVGGGHYNCGYALFNTNNLYTWGFNGYGQCGLGHTSIMPVPALSSTNVSEVFDHPTNGITVAYNRLFIKKTNNKIYGCGWNGAYGLGDGTNVNKNSWTEITGFGTTVSKLFNLGGQYGNVVALTTDGRILINGYNGNGQLGNGTATNIQTPTNVTNAWAGVASGITDLKVSTGDGRTLIMLITLSSGTKIVRSCGYNVHGQLGDGTFTQRTSPVTVLNSTNTIDIALFGGIACSCDMLKTTGNVFIWGYNGYGQLGNGTTTNNATPAANISSCNKLLSDGMVSQDNSEYIQNFVRKTNGELWTCGWNQSGYCGIGNLVSNITSFTKVLMPNNSKEYITDLGHYTTVTFGRITLAITNKNNIYVWGSNSYLGISDQAHDVDVVTPLQINMPIMND